MVVGSGLLANAFTTYFDNKSIVLFASGVSNSLETDITEFSREQKLLSDACKKYPQALFVYFSTTMVLNADVRSNAYVRHKLVLEKYISNNHPRFLIFRLPQVIGLSGNANTLLNYLYHGLVDGQLIEVWKNATRNIIDVDDVFKIVDFVVTNKIYMDKILNIAAYPMSVLEILRLLEEAVDIKANIQLIDAGNEFDIPCEMENVYNELNLKFDCCYVKNIINKYYKNR